MCASLDCDRTSSGKSAYSSGCASDAEPPDSFAHSTNDPSDCAAPTPEPGCCYGTSSMCNPDYDEAPCARMARRGGCEWRTGNDPDLGNIVTEAPTPSPTPAAADEFSAFAAA